MSATGRTVILGYVKLGADTRPKENVAYDVVSVSSEEVGSVEYPKESDFKRLNLDLYDFYVDDLPDFGKNEGLLKIQLNTRNPHDLQSSPTDATCVVKFVAKDGEYAPSFLYKGVFRNILFREWINLRLDLYELDTDAEVYYNKVKAIFDGAPELKNLDVTKGIPYLTLATKLFDGVIKVFGKNPDDHVWGELPMLELIPTPGGAFIRQGIFVLLEDKNSAKKAVSLAALKYKNGKIIHGTDKKFRLPNHLVFGVSLADYKEKIS